MYVQAIKIRNYIRSKFYELQNYMHFAINWTNIIIIIDV